MSDEYGELYIFGNAHFGGGSTAGLLLDGELYVMGNFSQGDGAPDAFAPAMDFYTVLGPDYYYYGGGLRAAPTGKGAKLRATLRGGQRAAPKLSAVQEAARAFRSARTKAHRDSIGVMMRNERRVAAYARVKATIPRQARVITPARPGKPAVFANSAVATGVT